MQDLELQDLVAAFSQYAISIMARLNVIERLVKERLNLDAPEIAQAIAEEKESLSALVQAKSGTTPALLRGLSGF